MLMLVTTILNFKIYIVLCLGSMGYTGTDASELRNGSLQHCEPIDEITRNYVSLLLDSQT